MTKTDIVAYTDGSFNLETSFVGASSIIRSNAVTIPNHYIIAQSNSDAVVDGRQISGELQGAINAIAYAIDCNFKSITIRYDYQGVEQWATGAWKANKNYTKSYQEVIAKFRDYIDIEFEKVAAHTGVQLNEVADQLAKYACGVNDDLPVGVHATQVVTLNP